MSESGGESRAGRGLKELRVVELKAELELRGQETKGKKAELIARLAGAMEAEGLDPDSHLFTAHDTSGGQLDSSDLPPPAADPVDAPPPAAEEVGAEEAEEAEEEAGGEPEEMAEEGDAVDAVDGADGGDEGDGAEEAEEAAAGDDEGIEVHAPPTDAADAKDEAKDAAEADAPAAPDDPGRHLVVKGLDSSTRATQLRPAFKAHGRVASTKMVTSGRHCFGFVSMAAKEDADACIAALNDTDFNGQKMSVERAKPEFLANVLKAATKAASSVDSTTPTGKKRIVPPEPSAPVAKKPRRDPSKDSKDTTRSKEKDKERAKDKEREKEKGKEKSREVRRVSPERRRPVPTPWSRPAAAATDRRDARRSIPDSRPPPAATRRFGRSPPPVARFGRVSPPTARFGRIAPARRDPSPPRRAFPDPAPRIGGRLEGRLEERPSHAAATRRGVFPVGSPSLSRSAERPGRLSDGRDMGREAPRTTREEELLEKLRRQEREHKEREQELELEKERERLRWEKEKFEREKLEFQQMKLAAQLAATQGRGAVDVMGGMVMSASKPIGGLSRGPPLPPSSNPPLPPQQLSSSGLPAAYGGRGRVPERGPAPRDDRAPRRLDDKRDSGRDMGRDSARHTSSRDGRDSRDMRDARDSRGDSRYTGAAVGGRGDGLSDRDRVSRSGGRDSGREERGGRSGGTAVIDYGHGRGSGAPMGAAPTRYSSSGSDARRGGADGRGDGRADVRESRGAESRSRGGREEASRGGGRAEGRMEERGWSGRTSGGGPPPQPPPQPMGQAMTQGSAQRWAGAAALAAAGVPGYAAPPSSVGGWPATSRPVPVAAAPPTLVGWAGAAPAAPKASVFPAPPTSAASLNPHLSFPNFTRRYN